MAASDQMDLLVEQVKMLAGDIAFSTSTLKRLMEQSVNDPESCKTQVFLRCLPSVLDPNTLIDDNKGYKLSGDILNLAMKTSRN